MRAHGRERRGQAAVETMFAIPVLLIFFMIGFQLFVLSWNAQYVNTKSRYKVLAIAHHRACWDENGNPAPFLNANLEAQDQETITTQALDFGAPGQVLTTIGGGIHQKSTAFIECR